MVITQSQQKLTFEQFLEQCPEDGRYELVNREIVKLKGMLVEWVFQRFL